MTEEEEEEKDGERKDRGGGRKNSRWTCPLPDSEAINASTTPGVVRHSARLIDGSGGGTRWLTAARSLIIHPSSAGSGNGSQQWQPAPRGAFISANRSLNSRGFGQPSASLLHLHIKAFLRLSAAAAA